MLATPDPAAIGFPHPEPPATGIPLEVAPGILWLRLALPFLLNHVNVYLIEDEGGWAVLDTGLCNEATRAAWEGVFTGALAGRRLTRVISSHFHPDHMGMAGELTRRFACPLSVTRTEFLMTKALENTSFAASPHFYAERGLQREQGSVVADDGHNYLRLVSTLPESFHRLIAGGGLRIGGRDFTILTGGGHSPEQAMLHCAADNIFFSTDQVMTRISPNISVQAMEPEADPLGAYLASLAALPQQVQADALVLPGHHLPFTGLHLRTAELATHHAQRCETIAQACATGPQTAAELMRILFKAADGFAPDRLRLRRDTRAYELYARARGTGAGAGFGGGFAGAWTVK